jgi:S-adenosylhomocysteine hydrolase
VLYKLLWTVLKLKNKHRCWHADIIITTTGNKDIILGSHLQMKDKTIVCNIDILITKLQLLG